MKNLSMPWCEWCCSYHSNKAPHIAREMYLLGATYQLFKSKAKAQRMGFGTANHRGPIRVKVIPMEAA